MESGADEYFDEVIIEEEAIASCKNNKSAGSDFIFNIYFKSSASLMCLFMLDYLMLCLKLHYYLKLGWWVLSCPFIKTKVMINSQKNHKPITLLSCMG